MARIDFYFDFRSPYAYFATERFDLLQTGGATIDWHPVSIDVLMNLQAGQQPWEKVIDPLCPAKRAHFMADIFRMIDFWEIPFAMPSPPVPSANTAMAVATLLKHAGVSIERFSLSVFRAIWQNQKDAEDRAVLIECIRESGMDETILEEAQGAGREMLTSATLAAFKAGVFGVPTFVLEDELYFGADRMELVARKLGTG